jgi:hypothetical protein
LAVTANAVTSLEFKFTKLSTGEQVQQMQKSFQESFWMIGRDGNGNEQKYETNKGDQRRNRSRKVSR